MMHNPPIERLDGENILALYDEGLRLVDIAAATGRSVAGVQKFLSGWDGYLPQYRRHPPPRRRMKAPPVIGAEETARMVALYGEGLNIRRIALATGRSRGGVLRVLRRCGVYDAARSAATRPGRMNDGYWRKSMIMPNRARSDRNGN